MATTLSPIPLAAVIVNPKDGTITNFFRLRWQELIDGFQKTNNIANLLTSSQGAAIPQTNAIVVKAAGLYRVSYYMRKTTPDGVSSSLTFTYGWIDAGQPLFASAVPLTLDSVVAEQSGSKLVFADANTALTYSVAYASASGAMQFTIAVVVEQVA